MFLCKDILLVCADGEYKEKISIEKRDWFNRLLGWDRGNVVRGESRRRVRIFQKENQNFTMLELPVRQLKFNWGLRGQYNDFYIYFSCFHNPSPLCSTFNSFQIDLTILGQYRTILTSGPLASKAKALINKWKLRKNYAKFSLTYQPLL